MTAFREEKARRREWRSQQRESIDLGLAVLSVVRPPGESLSCALIAEICECSTGAISAIERRALRKLRRAVEFRFPELAAEFREFLRASHAPVLLP